MDVIESARNLQRNPHSPGKIAQMSVLLGLAKTLADRSDVRIDVVGDGDRIPMPLRRHDRVSVNALRPEPEAIARPLWFIRVFGTMFMIFGVIALFLAGVGLYAVMAFSVSRRTREVGIRMALGAKPGDVLAMVVRQGVGQLGIGMVAGLTLALGVSQLLKIILFDVEPRDPAIFAAVVSVLSIAGLLACLIPARRATRVDPLLALRSD